MRITLRRVLQLMLIHLKVLLVLHQPDVCRHLRVYVRIWCANIRFRSVDKEVWGRRIDGELPSSAVAKGPTVPPRASLRDHCYIS